MENGNTVCRKKQKLNEMFLQDVRTNNSVKDEMVVINNRRLFYFCLVAVPVTVMNILFFATGEVPGGANEMKWRLGILICHSVLLILVLIFGISAYLMLHRERPNLFMKTVQTAAISCILAAGIILVSIDQQVTTNISPFIITCAMAALVFLIRPYMAVLIYSATFIGFYHFIALYQPDQAVLLSDRVNGICAGGLGLCLSLILWQANASKIVHKRLIESQKLELEEKNAEMEHLAFYDQMTNLYNRRSFEELVSNEISLIKRYEHESCMIILDMDNFKNINDDYGHPAGDFVLQEIAGLLKTKIRETDKASRWGGEEFVILLPNTPSAEGEQVAEKLRDIIEKTRIRISDIEVNVTASFGVIGLSKDTINTMELAYREVDKALYSAKEKGRNCVVAV